jgi:hypothetical protein
MLFKVLITFTILFSFHLKSQRRNYFPNSDKTPNCNLIKKVFFSNNEKGNNSLKVRFHNKKMIEVYGNNSIIIESKLKILSKCKFEAEIKNLKSKFQMTDSLFYVGKKTVYEVVETGKSFIIYEYWCNEGRNICTEMLEKE